MADVSLFSYLIQPQSFYFLKFRPQKADQWQVDSFQKWKGRTWLREVERLAVLDAHGYLFHSCCPPDKKKIYRRQVLVVINQASLATSRMQNQVFLSLFSFYFFSFFLSFFLSISLSLSPFPLFSSFRSFFYFFSLSLPLFKKKTKKLFSSPFSLPSALFLPL